MTAPGWEKAPDGKGYRRIEQGVQFRRAMADYAKLYIWACYLYYEGPTDAESPLSDDVFDSIQRALETYRSETPEWFRKRTKAGALKTDGHSLHYSEAEKAAALAWAQPKK